MQRHRNQAKINTLIGQRVSRFSNTTNEARFDIRTCGVWERGQ